jgi:hypothetical protein
VGSDGFENVFIGTLGVRDAFSGVAKGRAAKNSVLASLGIILGACALI